ncbi:MAG: acyl-CoA thioester hydrolase/BAAT C-terminal domain-containing protein [Acidimicrobiales bacterium]|jgi:dienelactone hydrolase
MGLRTMHRVFLVVCAGVVLAAMVAVKPATATAGGLQLTVTPSVSAADTPLTIRVSGAQPRAKVVLSVTSVDAAGTKWSSTSIYAATSAGTVDPATSPENGVYVGGPPSRTMHFVGTDPMGPVDFMAAPLLSPGLVPFWPFGLMSPVGSASSTQSLTTYWWAKCSLSQAQHGCTWSKPLSFTFTATNGKAHASVTVQRGPALPVTASFESVAATGFYGVFWQPPAGQDNHVGIVEFGGSEGGIDTSYGAMLAARGYPTLDLAYFGEPGLPQAPIGQVPEALSLDYFAKALRWLGRQPGVDPRRLWVMGFSMGSEAALLLGVDYPGLVHGVVALSPNDVAACLGPGVPLWTFGGKPVPCTNQFNKTYPTDNPAAVIPVAKIHGPVLLECGEQDSVWSSCAHSKAMMAELAAAYDTYPHELLDYPDAGHGLGFLLPYYPGIAPLEQFFGIGGSSVVANPLARADQWPKLLAFLRN